MEFNGKMIAAIRNKDVLLGLLNDCKDSFEPTGYEHIRTSIRMSEMRDDEYAALRCVIFNDDSRSIFNGYGVKSIAKLFDIIEAYFSLCDYRSEPSGKLLISIH